MLITISSILWLFIIFCLILLYRVERVYKYRVDLIWDDFETYNKLPSYNEMVWKFWIWDLDKFVKEKVND